MMKRLLEEKEHVLSVEDDTSLDYQSVPPSRTVTMNTRFFVRGRGQPKPYPLEDYADDEIGDEEE